MNRSDVDVLLVDTDDCFRRAMAIALRLEGLVVLEACCAREALECIALRPVALAVVEVWLGSERSDALMEKIVQLSPRTRLVSTSGRPGMVSALAAQGRVRQMDKPLQPDDVLKLIPA